MCWLLMAGAWSCSMFRAGDVAFATMIALLLAGVAAALVWPLALGKRLFIIRSTEVLQKIRRFSK